MRSVNDVVVRGKQRIVSFCIILMTVSLASVVAASSRNSTRHGIFGSRPMHYHEQGKQTFRPTGDFWESFE